VPFWLSDAFCRLASGGSFAVRQLYTDDEEVLFQAARPILLNGIDDVISRPDLADRAIFLTLPPIAEAQRRPEAELWREFEIGRPLILGALLDAAVHGLRLLVGQGCRPRGLPRMADFALWISACESAIWPAGTFACAYAANRRAAIESMIDADPVASCVREIIAQRKTWIGTAAELLSFGLGYPGDRLSWRSWLISPLLLRIIIWLPPKDSKSASSSACVSCSVCLVRWSAASCSDGGANPSDQLVSFVFRHLSGNVVHNFIRQEADDDLEVIERALVAHLFNDIVPSRRQYDRHAMHEHESTRQDDKARSWLAPQGGHGRFDFYIVVNGRSD
jgi:hypothetical protein